MIDGLETERMTINAISGNTLAVGASEVGVAEIANSVITQAKFNPADTFQAGTNTLSTGNILA